MEGSYIGWKEMSGAIRLAEDAGLPVKFDVEFRPFRSVAFSFSFFL